MFARLPKRIQATAELAYLKFLENPDHSALRRHQLEDSDKGRHRNGTWSVSITMQYRALYFVVEDVNLWYWVGNHNDYENFTGKK
jgi:hypothetical protein